MFIEEVKKIVRRNEFYAAAIIIFFAVFLNFYIACDNLQGKPLSQIPSAWELTVLRNYYCYNFTDTVFSTLLPLIASIMAADVYYTELKKGITNYIATRTSCSSYIRNKVLAAGTVVFVTVGIAVAVSIVLSIIAFPLQGHYSTDVSFRSLMMHDRYRILCGFEGAYPYLNIIFFGFIRCLFAVSSALFAFSMTFIKRINHYLLMLSSTIYYFVYILLVTLIANTFADVLSYNWADMINTSVTGVNRYGSIYMIFFYIVFQAALAIFIIRRGVKKGDCIL